ncbi:cache domain-containing protein [Paenibacillus mucilaginosus]|uniref:cache domain-containing protein n=1 Tax=Paenibacillus mucilaginosus TaxID=61624 RepID=UPI0002E789C8|nr:cache domain-containing protein [Paenibacillus mucilaginosus]
MIDRPYFLDALNGQEHISDLTMAKSTNEPLIFFSTPVRDESGTVTGLLLGSVKLEVIDRLLATLQPPTPGSDSYLVDLGGPCCPTSDIPRSCSGLAGAGGIPPGD